MIDSAALSDKGLKRGDNQDRYLVDGKRKLFLLADGMGGHKAGQVASQITLEAVEEFVSLATGDRQFTWPFGYDSQSSFRENVLLTALRLANLRVCQAAQQQEKWAGMGSTVIMLWLIKEGLASYAHVGDSRLYLLRDGELRQLTRDHSVVEEQIQAGLISAEQARAHNLRHVLTQAIGVHQPLNLEAGEVKVEPGDLFLLCSDGLSDQLEDGAIAGILDGDSDLDRACRELVDAANREGGEDNVTVVLVRSGKAP